MMENSNNLPPSITSVGSQPNGDMLFYSAILSERREIEKLISDAMDVLSVKKNKGLMTHVADYEFRLVLDEALENALIHGNRGDVRKRIRVRIVFSSMRIVMTIEDEGEGFRMDKSQADPEKENIFRPHGRGIPIMKAIANARWNRKGNIVTLTL